MLNIEVSFTLDILLALWQMKMFKNGSLKKFEKVNFFRFKGLVYMKFMFFPPNLYTVAAQTFLLSIMGKAFLFNLI